MTSLHAPTARLALPDVDPECAHDHAGDGEFFLVLRRDAPLAHGPTAARTGGRQRRLVSLIDATRSTPPRFRSILRARLPSGPSRMIGQRFGKRGRLPMRRPPRLVELLLQPIVFTPQAVAFPFGAFQLPAQPIAFLLRAFGPFTQVIDLASSVVIARRLLRHPTFMADSGKRASYGILDPEGGTSCDSLITR